MSTFWYKDVFLRRYFFRSSVAHNNKRRTGPKWGGIDVGSEKREENKKKVEEEEEEERKGKRRRRCVQWPDGTSWVESSRHFSCVRPSLSFLTWRVDDDVTRTADRQQHAFFGCWFPMTRRAALSKAELHAASQPAAAFYFSIFGRLFQHAANRMHQILEFQGKMRIDPSTHQEVLSTAVCSRGEKRPLQVRQFFFPPNETVRWPQPSEYQIRREKYSRLLLLLLRLLSVSCSIPAHLLTVPTWRAIWNRLK